MSEKIKSGPGRTETRDTVLEVRNVEVTYEMGRGRARVLDDIDVAIERGETLGIVGESGSGKSMFASSLMHAVQDPGVLNGEIVYHPEDGDSVNLLDLSTRKLKAIRWEEIAIVYQGAMNAFNPTLTIGRHFTETFEAHDVDPDSGLERARDIIKDLNLDPDRLLEAYSHELSGGEKQRALIALGLVFDPEVLILDEPTAAMDLLTQRYILEMLYEIKEEYDLTLVFISHDMPIIAGFADRIAVMYSFEFVEFGNAREVLLQPEHPYTRLLLGATLDLETPLEATHTIEGSPPDPVNVPLGCSFAPRCPISADRCEAEDPELRAEDTTHEVACFFPNRSVEEIGINTADQRRRD
jgi:oligopeptide/dipeptide ABC transporter ATP-binding protein